ncbi:pantothenate transporter liz1 [Cylindrobasidium torrendii FP15055 ss-10]|uniref:Pantothenate transporter liz1 n=1 Tax=Cylindrobasidium torrendii FP15055 ss-10 TaxID=1314674 RepID=A0A0D7BA80_9AGAR|nr:pantothenate transporter liz1 [Cylindrobasidium torrendii FP15055 ss-10]
MDKDQAALAPEWKKPETFKEKLLSYLWDADNHLKTPFERKLVRKLDFGILVVACLGFFMRYLDSANLANAYVSGMKEDLVLNGNEYTYMGTCYTVAYALFQIPGTMMVTRVRPSYFLFACEVGWGIFTFAQAGAQNAGQMYAFRFCVGLFEAPFFPSLLYVLGSWYNKYELAKRMAIFHLSGSLGSAFGGYLQAAIYETLDGARGIAGWRWLYIVCGCMTIPCGLAVLFLLPDLPSNSRAWYLTEEERDFALDRAVASGKSQPGERKINLDLVKRMFTSWKWYAFVLGYTIYGISCQAGDYFSIWLKSAGYSVAERNVIPSCARLLNALCIFLWGFGSDLSGSRFAFVFGPLAYGLLPTGVLAFWPKSQGFKLFAFFTSGVQLMTAVFYTWVNEINAGDNELRAITISSMNGVQYAISAWLPIVIFPQTMAPTFRRGFPATFGFVIAGLIIIVGIKVLADRDARRRPATVEEASDTQETQSIDEKSPVDGAAIGTHQDGVKG